jgi:hypothetical protein
MYCKNCGKEHNDDALFCAFCGESIVEKEPEKKPAKCWSIFAGIAKALGIVTIATFWIPIFGLYSMIPGIHGIVFGVLGKYAKEEPFVSKARSGFVLSLVGTILSIVMFIGFVACIGLMAE